MASPVGNHIVDPRILNNEHDLAALAAAQNNTATLPAIQLTRPSTAASSTVVGSPTTSISSVHTLSTSSQANPFHTTHENLYSNLATFTFGDAPSSTSDTIESISPLTPIRPHSSADRTPRPSLASPSFHHNSSHPTQGPGRPASIPSSSPSQPASPHARTRSPPAVHRRPRPPVETDDEDSEDPIHSSDISISALRGRFQSDAASQHTFGHIRRDAAPSSSASLASSRSSSPSSFRSRYEFSDEEDMAYGENIPSPVIFARDDLADIDEYDMGSPAPFFHHAIAAGRRGSLPMAIPGAISGDGASVRSRDDSILTLRRPSRSLDDDVGSAHLLISSNGDPDAVTPKSEPLSRGDWRTLEAQVHAQEHQQQQQTDSGNVYDGLNLTYILSRNSDGGSIGSRRSSTLSYVQPARRTHQGQPTASVFSSLTPWYTGRRTSTATLGSGDDTFTGMVKRVDENYGKWCFRKEKADGLGISASSSVRSGGRASVAIVVQTSAAADKAKKSMLPGAQELWRNEYIGRFKVDRLALRPTSADPGKAPQQRINVRHIHDPYSKGNIRGGPSGVIHKHSRAIAFSIFRSYDLFNSGAGRRNASRNPRMSSIMLAPKRVQEQYTSTKTTGKLNTHGFLDNASPRSGSDRTARPTNQSLSFRERERREKDIKRAKEKEEAKAKAAAKAEKKANKKKGKQSKPTESAESSATATSQTSSTGSVNIKPDQVASAPARASTSKVTLSPTLSASTTVGRRRSVGSRPVSPVEPLPMPLEKEQALSIRGYHQHHPRRGHRDSIDLDEPLVTRTPHAEAFATLDPNDVSHFHSKPPSRSNNTDSGGPFGIFKGFWRSNSSSRHADHALGPSSASIENAYSPPWITTAPAPVQEGNERLMQGLNESFKDVGLLHQNKAKQVTVSKAKTKQRATRDIFEQVPDDSLYMLLPLWPRDTDARAMAQNTGPPPSAPAVDDRQYLLVYYVPFDERNKGKDPEPSTSKKKSKSQSTSEGTIDMAERKYVLLTSFRVCARLVAYGELRGSGVRVPSEGLSVTGAIWEAMSYLPSPTLRQDHIDDLVISHSSSRDKGFEFVPEGLGKLGLCMPSPASETLTPDVPPPESEEEESDVLLTPIGRAAVEMVWLGCLALTSFGL